MTCPICSKSTVLLGKVDLNRDCLGLLPLQNEKFIEYYICTYCKFISAPTMYKWASKEFREKIYNNEYTKIDPDFISVRPRVMARSLVELCPDPRGVKHLDYGGGTGTLSNILKEVQWDSSYYDPYMSTQSKPSGKFNLVTSIEVFEHSNNPKKLIKDILEVLSSKGVLIFTTFLSDNKQSIDWNYIAPRNGHISIYSKLSLELLAKQYNMNFRSFSETTHIMWKKVPNWAIPLNLAA